MNTDVHNRFWSKVDQSAGPDGCWIWTASTRKGYGRAWVDGRVQPAHRVAFEQLRGPVPDGLDLDHLCRNRSCVNPAHLEPVTRGENLRRGNGWSGRNARKTHCKYGHEFDASNTLIENGKRTCRICKKRREREVAERRKLDPERMERLRARQRDHYHKHRDVINQRRSAS